VSDPTWSQSSIGPDGHSNVLGAGPISFRCVEPFRKWIVSYDGEAYDGSVQQQMSREFSIYADAGPYTFPRTSVSYEELETQLGVTKIGGSTQLCTFHLGNQGVNGFNNQQSGVRYTLDGMSTLGMIERSLPADLGTIVAPGRGVGV
jgi:hypothetical protein